VDYMRSVLKERKGKFTSSSVGDTISNNSRQLLYPPESDDVKPLSKKIMGTKAAGLLD